MNVHMLLLGASLLVAACSGADRDDEFAEVAEPDSLFANMIPIDMDLRLREGFDYSSYHGVIESSSSLNRLWSQLVNVQQEFYGRRADVPDPPTVDFSGYVVLWFADRGVGASFVDSLGLSVVSGRDSVVAVVHAFHSDFGSRRLNLWQMPRTTRRVVFQVRHTYETRAP